MLEFRLSTPDKLGMTLGKLVRKLKPSQAWDVNKMPSLVSTTVTVHSGENGQKSYFYQDWNLWLLFDLKMAYFCLL